MGDIDGGAGNIRIEDSNSKNFGKRFLKSSKIRLAIMAASAVISAIVFSLLSTWQFALLLMLFLVIHEGGHLWAMKKSGMNTWGMYFIPLLGAVAVPDGKFPSRIAEIFVCIMGPIWGFALILPAIGIYLWNQNPLFAGIAGILALLNFLNLLPIGPLDGGKIFKSVASSIHPKGIWVFLSVNVIMGLLSLATKFWVFGIILAVLGGLGVFAEYKEEKSKQERKEKKNAKPSLIAGFTVIYILALFVFGITLFVASETFGSNEALSEFSGIQNMNILKLW